MVLVEASRNPIVINEETKNLLFYKSKTKELKSFIIGILSGKLRLKNAEDQKAVDSYIDEHKSDLDRLYKALNEDISVYLDENNALKAVAIPFAISTASMVAGTIAGEKGSEGGALASFIIAAIGYLTSLVLSVKTAKEEKRIKEGIDSLYIIRKELKKVDPKRIKDKRIREKYQNLLDDIDDITNRYDTVTGSRVRMIDK